MNKEQLGTIEMLSTTRKFAVGNDLVLLSEFKQSFNKLFEAKVYTESEIYYCNLFEDPMLRFAATWAAKEAVYKAIKQVDQHSLSYKKIEIKRDKIGGIPNVILHHQAKPNFQISLSITHDGDYVWAIAILEIHKNNPNLSLK